MTSSVIAIYIITIVISIAVAFLLVHLARSSSQAKADSEGKRRMQKDFSSGVAGSESMKKVISDEISEIVDSQKERQQISETVTEIFNKEITKRVNYKTQELSRKYEEVIREKDRSEDIAWKKYNKVLANKRETEAVIRSIAEGLVVVDAKGKVVMMNPAAEKLLGISRDKKIGKPITDGLKDEQLISLVKDSSGDEKREIELASKEDETKKTLRASTAVIEDGSGQTVGMVSVLSDITKQKQLDAMKSAFVANVSHELRTPLVAIEKSITLALSKSAGRISDTQRQFLTIAERNLKRLSALINDLLDLSKLEAGKMEFKPALQPLEDVINESVEALNVWADSKSLKISKTIPPGLPEVRIDSNKIIQVLNNLIGNAIKYTPNGGDVFIEAALRGDKNEIEVSVKDTGIGMSEEELPKVFDKFYRIGERAHTDISGTGIGLSIAKEIVGLHGGKIWVESKKGGGAKFIFTLPLK